MRLPEMPREIGPGSFAGDCGGLIGRLIHPAAAAAA
jgi:hypothetical protein